MSKTNIQTLQRRVERFHLLAPDRKKKLLKQLPFLSPEQQEQLQVILDGENQILPLIADRVVSIAIEKGDKKLLDRLDNFFARTGTKLRKTEEGVGRAGEVEQLEHFFEDTNT